MSVQSHDQDAHLTEGAQDKVVSSTGGQYIRCWSPCQRIRVEYSISMTGVTHEHVGTRTMRSLEHDRHVSRMATFRDTFICSSLVTEALS